MPFINLIRFNFFKQRGYTIQINDKRFKELSSKVGKIYTDIAVIKSEVIEVKEHLKKQNEQIFKNLGEINSLKVEQAGIKGKIWVFVVIGGFLGSVVGAITIKFVIGG